MWDSSFFFSTKLCLLTNAVTSIETMKMMEPRRMRQRDSDSRGLGHRSVHANRDFHDFADMMGVVKTGEEPWLSALGSFSYACRRVRTKSLVGLRAENGDMLICECVSVLW